MDWTLEKTNGKLALFSDLQKTGEQNGKSTKVSIPYSGALFTLDLKRCLRIKSMTNFYFLNHPQGLPWSEYQYRIQDLCAVELEEQVGIPVPVAYKSTILPFAGYSYIKLDYKPDYNLIPGNEGHNVYHTLIAGLEYDIQVNRIFRTETYIQTALHSYNYPLAATNSHYIGFGNSFIFNFEYFGVRIYFSTRNNTEKSNIYSNYTTRFQEIGFTFRIW